MITVPSAPEAESLHVLFVHAHPDDETLQTGPYVVECVQAGCRVDVVTCTRGEKGEIVPGSIPNPDPTPEEYVSIREGEIAQALTVLGVENHYWLGQRPARADGLSERRYRDSGMRWIADGLAGPAADADDDAFSVEDLQAEAADLAALITAIRPDMVVGYDDEGSYGHPDHVRAHQVTRLAAQMTGVKLVEVASRDDAEGFDWFTLGHTERVVRALDCYRTQLTVRDGHIVHVGGQIQQIPTRVGVRVVNTSE